MNNEKFFEKPSINNKSKIKRYRLSDYLGDSIFRNFAAAEEAINKLQYIVRRSYLTTTEERELYGQDNQDSNGDN